MKLEKTGNWVSHLTFLIQGAWCLKNGHPAMVSVPCWVLPFQLASTWPQGLCQRSLARTLISSKAHRKLESSLLATGQPGSPQELSACILSLRHKSCSLETLSSRGCSSSKRPLQSWAPHCLALCDTGWGAEILSKRAIPMGRLNSAESFHTQKPNWRLTVLT